MRWGRPWPDPARAAAWIAAAALADRDRWALWLPVFLGGGIVAYFSLSREPSLLWAAAGFLLAILLTFLGARQDRQALRWALALSLAAPCLGAFTAGMLLAQGHARLAAAPVLQERLGPVSVEGRLEALEPRLGRARVILSPVRIDGLDPALTPHRVRLTVASPAGEGGTFPAMGSWVSLRAVLLPPPEPAFPGGFDFSRTAWFERIGAVGYGVSRLGVVTGAMEQGGSIIRRFMARVDDARGIIFQRVTGQIEGANGAIAAALMTGERGHIPAPIMDSIRVSGLAHLLAISGLHIGLVTGILFFATRAALALSPSLALRYPIKKWAAAGALVGAFFYLLLTGATVPTQRAFMMTAVVLLAVMVDRAALSMRLVAWAAVVVMVFAPQAVLGPSFQMSFAAVVALIAGYEALRERRLRHPVSPGHGGWGMGRTIFRYGLGVMITTIIASLATAPFALFHFNRLSVLGLVANLIAVPATALWVMPWAVVAYVLMPVGLESLALVPMGWGIALILWVAEGVAGLPGAALSFPAMPVWGLALLVLGGLWLAIWRGAWRLAGIPLIVAGLGAQALASPPDLILARGGHGFGVVLPQGVLVVGGEGVSRFERESWSRWAGYARPVSLNASSVRGAVRGALAGQESDLRCDSLGCVLDRKGQRIVVILRPEALGDCEGADLAVMLGRAASRVALKDHCHGARRILHWQNLGEEGAHALWLGRGGRMTIRSVAMARGDRPWVANGAQRD